MSEDKETWAQRVKQRTHAAVLQMDMARELGHEVGKTLSDHMEKEIFCTGIDAIDVVRALSGSPEFKDLIKTCLREVLQEAAT